MLNSVRDDRHVQAARPWRVLFVLYAVALTLGTHWPRLELRIDDMPAPDKILHMLGFGGLTFLLWRTRWLRLERGVWPLAIIALLWAVLDELTQAIPFLGRSFSWMDIAGGWLGIALVLVWIWAVRPIGDKASRERHVLNERILDDLFLRVWTWVLVGGAGLVGAASLGTPLAMYVHGIDHRAALAGFAAAGIVGGAAGSLVMLGILWRSARAGHSMQPLPAGIWSRALWHGAATLVGGASLLLALYMFAYKGDIHAPWAMILLDTPSRPAASRVPPDLRLAIDLTLLGMVVALSVRICRETLARAVDTLCSDGRSS